MIIHFLNMYVISTYTILERTLGQLRLENYGTLPYIVDQTYLIFFGYESSFKIQETTKGPVIKIGLEPSSKS